MPTNAMWVPPPRRSARCDPFNDHDPEPDGTRDDGTRDDGTRDDGTRDDAPRDDRNHTADGNTFQEAPHPSSGFRVVRFTLGLTNGTSATGQPIELCFHHDFTASPARPLSLHFDQSDIITYREPPVLEAPPPPGVMVELGRVDTLPDDPRYIALLDDQIQREVDEYARPDGERRRPHRGLSLQLSLGRLLLAIMSLTSLGVILASISMSTPTTPPTASPVTVIPLMDHVSRFILATPNLCPIIFFNHFLYPTIGNDSGLPPGKIWVLDQSWAMARELDPFILEPMVQKSKDRFQASNKDEDDVMRLLSTEYWEYAGVRRNDTNELRDRGRELLVQIDQLWHQISMDVFGMWVADQIINLAGLVVSLKYAKLSPEDDMFITQGNNTSLPILRSSLPQEMPSGISFILDSYRVWFPQDKLLESTCRVLSDCSEPIPASAPPTQVVHPACFHHHDTETMLKNLTAWAVSARGRNLTFDEFDPYFTLMTSEQNRMREYFWPNKTAFPDLLDQVRILAQFRDTMYQILEITDVIEDQQERDAAKSVGVLHRFNRWVRGPRRDAREKMAKLRKHLDVHLTRQLRDLVEGLRAAAAICRQIDALHDLMDELGSPEAWIISEDKTYVQLRKMPHPSEQIIALGTLKGQAMERLYKIRRYQKQWLEWEEEEEEEGRKDEA